MNELSVTWRRAGRVYWSLFWRGMVFFWMPAFAVVYFLGLILRYKGMPIEPYLREFQFVLMPISIAISVWIIKDVLTSEIGTFRIALISTDEDPAKQGVQADGPTVGGTAP